MSTTEPQINPSKIRVGLAMIGVFFVAAAVLFVVVDDVVARAIFFAIALTALVRVVLLVRWLRKGGAAGAGR